MSRFTIIIFIFVSTFVVLRTTSVLAQDTLRLAPERTTMPVSQSKAPVLPNEFSAISEWEAKIIEAIPDGIKNQVNAFDARRISLAQKYTELRDISQAHSLVSVKTKGTTIEASVDGASHVSYYWYSALSFFFSYRFAFYGSILLGVFLIFRVILRYFNLII